MAEIVHYHETLSRNFDSKQTDLIDYLNIYGCDFISSMVKEWHPRGGGSDERQYFHVGDCTVEYKKSYYDRQETERVTLIGRTKEIVDADVARLSAAIPTLHWLSNGIITRTLEEVTAQVQTAVKA